MTERRDGCLGEGAARAAPTAPHATAPLAAVARSGPERFWARAPVRFAFAVALALSLAIHATLLPLRITSVEVREVEGDTAIPVDVLTSGDVPAASAPTPGEPSTPPTEPDRGHPDETASITRDAGRPVHLNATDAGTKYVDASAGDGGSDASTELAPDAASAAGPEALIREIQSDRVLVMLVIDVAAVRANPVGAGMGYLVRGIPQWQDLLSDTKIDPLGDTDWIVISGPSFVNTARDVVLIHYSAPEALVDRAVRSLARRDPHGGVVDAGVLGVQATLVQADRAERVILRPKPRVLAVVPPAAAHKVARQLSGAKIAAPIRAGDAVYLRFVSPHRALPELPEAIEEMRMRITPRSDGGADVFLEGDTGDSQSAASAAGEVQRFFRRHDDALTSLLTHGILDHVEVGAEGSLVKAHLTATRDQIATLVALVGDVLGVQPDEAPVPPGSAGAPPRVR
ncbi:MAG TPA: hypothetical protein VEK07_22465 [Polyangiaceae bacterium]|nr:hypothetical protein [Polyangiaceae bacterium]